MASKESKVSVISRGTSVRNQKKSYYVTNVTTLADGSVQRETFRTDQNGNNQVKISQVTAKPDGTIEDEVLSTATAEEKKDLGNPDSKLRKEIRHQTDSVKEDIVENNVDGVTSDTVDKAGGRSGNTENNSDDNAGGGDADTPTEGAKLKDVQQRTDYEDMRYPLDLSEETQDFLKIMMVEYEPRGLTVSGGSAGIPPRGNLESIQRAGEGSRNILSNIYLPIPNGIQDNNTVNWGKDEIDPLKTAAADIIGKMIEGGDVGGAATGVKDAVQENQEGVKATIGSKITESITGVNKLAREQGAVLNNNLELLFKGPQLRDFTFNFMMSARSSDEGKQITKIIRTLKQGMSAKKSNGFLFIKSPHTFFLGYYKGTELHPYLNRFKECALTGLSVNYAPAQYSTYVDGVMTQYQITMTFKELEPVFDDDYTGKYENIGF